MNHHRHSQTNHTNTNTTPINPQPSPQTTTTPYVPISTDAWGDHLIPIPTEELPHTLRIGFQNARGIYTYKNWSKWTNACQFIKQHKFSIFGSVETNIHWNHKTKHTLHSHTERHLTTPRTVTTSCYHHPSHNLYRPGGSLLISSGRWTRRCH